MNRYRVTCLTPMLVGDGRKLAPIDYMVWKDQVNILDQNRIFRLLSKGPRLDSYLSQIRRAEKLDFASWGGYAQNFASRRIPLDDHAAETVYQRAQAEDLFIPTFTTGTSGIYLPGSALKGALRNALLMRRMGEIQPPPVGLRTDDGRPIRNPGSALERSVLGGPHASPARAYSISDSSPVAGGSTRVYLLRTASLLQRGQKLELGWKSVRRGTVENKRVSESTPQFAEMAAPGAAFEGTWSTGVGLSQPEVRKSLRWNGVPGAKQAAEAANEMAAALLSAQRAYAELCGMSHVLKSLDGLAQRLETARQADGAFLVNIGWAGGLLSKSAPVLSQPEKYRQVLRDHPAYAQAIRTGLPFPKTCRLIVRQDHPVAVPGWVMVELIA